MKMSSYRTYSIGCDLILCNAVCVGSQKQKYGHCPCLILAENSSLV